MKHTQNIVSESRLSQPISLMIATIVWLAAGLVSQQWWIQFASFLTTVLVMAEINNGHALIRISSRIVSVAFAILSCTGCFLFHSLEGAISSLCIAASLLMLFHTYKDFQSPGRTFYAFMLLGISSLTNVHTFFFVPVYWALMFFYTYSLSRRTFAASLLGLALPYGIASAWELYQVGHLTPLSEHFRTLTIYRWPADYSSLSTSRILAFAFVLVTGSIGSTHVLSSGYLDKYRIRQLYHCFILLFTFSAVLLILQPQHYDLCWRVMIISCSPLIGHFAALTSSRFTNFIFCTLLTAAVLITVINLWTLLFLS